MNGKCSCRKAFTDALTEKAAENKSIIAIATDSGGSVTLGKFIKELPGQFVELGIAEQNAVALAAGLSGAGKKVFVCGPACFLSARAFEQVKVDVAYNKSDVKIIGVSSGVSYGPLGGTHTSLHDIAGMRALPNIQIFTPSDSVQADFITRYLCEASGPAYMRMGRGDVNRIYADDEPFDIQHAKTLREGKDAAIIAAGEAVWPSLKAAELLAESGISVRVLDMFRIKPFDSEAVIRAAAETGAIVTAEEHSINGGLGEQTAHVISENRPVPLKIIGFPDEEVTVGSSAQLFEYYGLTAENIAENVRKVIAKKGK